MTEMLDQLIDKNALNLRIFLIMFQLLLHTQEWRLLLPKQSANVQQWFTPKIIKTSTVYCKLEITDIAIHTIPTSNATCPKQQVISWLPYFMGIRATFILQNSVTNNENKSSLFVLEQRNLPCTEDIKSSML